MEWAGESARKNSITTLMTVCLAHLTEFVLDRPAAIQQPRAQVDFENVSASCSAVEETIILRDLKNQQGEKSIRKLLSSKHTNNEKFANKT